MSPSPPESPIRHRAEELFAEQERRITSGVDHLFAGLLMVQWMAAVGVSLWISPRAWRGTSSQVHLHVWLAVCLGAAIAIPPMFLAMFRSSRPSTRYLVAIGQMLMGSLLIHLTGGRIETHFHVFGSLALLAFYRDWKVLVVATIVVVVDHVTRGTFWPFSVFA